VSILTRLTVTFDVIGFDEAAFVGVGPPARNTSREMIEALVLTLLLVVWEQSLLLRANSLDPSFGDALDRELLHGPESFQYKMLYLFTFANHQTFEVIGIGASGLRSCKHAAVSRFHVVKVALPSVGSATGERRDGSRQIVQAFGRLRSGREIVLAVKKGLLRQGVFKVGSVDQIAVFNLWSESAGCFEAANIPREPSSVLACRIDALCARRSRSLASLVNMVFVQRETWSVVWVEMSPSSCKAITT